MKRTLCIVLLSGICSLSYSQQTSNHSYPLPTDKLLLMEFSTGATFDLIHKGQNPNAALLGTKSRTTPLFGIRMTYLFSEKMGWYLHPRFNLYEHKRSEQAPSIPLESFWKEFAKWAVGTFSYRIHPEVEAGILYRLERQRWQLHPHVGLGCKAYLPDSYKNKTVTTQGEKHSVFYKQRVNPWFMNVGFSVNYYLSRNTYLLLDASYHQPLGKSYARLTRMRDDTETQHLYYQTTTAGRNLNTSLGVGFCLSKNRK